MAREEKITKEQLEECETEDLCDEMISRLEIAEQDARDLKNRLMKSAGYKVVPTYRKPEKQTNKRKSFFGGNDAEEEDDDFL